MRSHWPLLGVLIVAYFAIYALFYPPIEGIEDEAGFVNQGIVWLHGTLDARRAGFRTDSPGFPGLTGFIFIKARFVAWRNPGRSLIALPFLYLWGQSSVFYSAAFIHVATTLISALLLFRLGASPLWAELILFHPTLLLFSRTVMGDEAAGLGLLLSVLCFTLKRPGLPMGLAIAFGASMRYQSAVAVPFLALALALKPGTSWRETVRFLTAASAFGVAIALYNHALYGNITGWINQGFFSLDSVPRNALFYLGAVSFLWPLQLLAPFLDKSAVRWPTRAVCLSMLAFLLPYYWIDHGGSWLETAVIGQRLLQSALPVWITSYSLVLDNLGKHVVSTWRHGDIPRRWCQAFALACSLLLVAGDVAISRQHNKHLQELVDARNETMKLVPGNSAVIGNGTWAKLFAVGLDQPSHYHWTLSDYQGTPLEPSPTIRASTWYLVFLDKAGNDTGRLTRFYQARFHLEKIPARTAGLTIYRHWAEVTNKLSTS